MKKIYWLLALALLCSPSFVHAKDEEDDEPTVTKNAPATNAEEEAEAPEEAEQPAKGGGKKAADTEEESGEKADDASNTATLLPSSTKTAMAGKVGKTLGVSIDEKGKQDFDFDLPKGQFFVYLDAQAVGEGSITSNIDATLYLLKRNGAEMPQYSGSLIYWNSRDRTSRVGKPFSFSKPTGVRFRIKSDADGANNFWLTVVPAQPANFLPFGFGSPIKTAKIGPNNGTGGPLDPGEFEYLRAAIPAGKWSISLGAKTEGGSCYVSMNSFNARGVDYPSSFSTFGVGKDERKEEIITLTKPTTLIIRVINDGGAGSNPVTYDVTIEPATE